MILDKNSDRAANTFFEFYNTKLACHNHVASDRYGHSNDTRVKSVKLVIVKASLSVWYNESLSGCDKGRYCIKHNEACPLLFND